MNTVNTTGAEAFNIVGRPESSELAVKVDAALRAALAKTDLNVDEGIYSIDGMSGKRYRYFINTLLGAMPGARYLEIGSWMGSTLCSAVHGNKVSAVAIDNWSEFGGPKDAFLSNLRKFATPEMQVTFIEMDFKSVDYNKLGKFNVYLFDGPHAAEDQYYGLALPQPCLEDEFIFIVDDWNWGRVRDGTFAALKKCNLDILYAAEVRTTLDGRSPPHVAKLNDLRKVRDFDWHNGYFISVLRKPVVPSK